ncbi:MAG TPA: c-type cytochrome [Alphaproteobacteria bacterium]|nr:c-type cytochrome [Alphaproteobacteria bacterium]
MTRGFLKPAFAVSVFTAVVAAISFGAQPAAAGHIKDDSVTSKTRLLFPVLNPERGREIFVRKGCVKCHSINGAGGTIGPPLDATVKNRVINPFSFAANMWNHAPGMIAAQKKKLGAQLHFTGKELGDIIAFIQDDYAQSDFGKLVPRKRGSKDNPEIRLVMPIMSPERGKKVFVNKGCVTCHSFNGVGGDDAPAMDSHTKEDLVNPFAFVAKMWDHAPGMIAAQKDELGGQLHFTGAQLADITAFIHDEDARRSFSKKDLTPRIRKMMSKMEGMDEGGKNEDADKKK